MNKKLVLVIALVLAIPAFAQNDWIRIGTGMGVGSPVMGSYPAGIPPMPAPRPGDATIR